MKRELGSSGTAIEKLENNLNEFNRLETEKLEQEIKALLEVPYLRSVTYIMLGARLFMIREEKLFQLKGYASFSDWTEALTDMPYALIDNCISLYVQVAEALADMDQYKLSMFSYSSSGLGS